MKKKLWSEQCAMCIAISKITKILKLLHKLVLHENQNNFSISVLSIEQISYCYLLLKEFPFVIFSICMCSSQCQHYVNIQPIALNV